MSAIKIKTERVLKNNLRYRKVNRILGVLEKDTLPKEYLQGFPLAIKIDKGIYVKDMYGKNDIEEFALNEGDLVREDIFQHWISVLHYAGLRLYQINKQTKENDIAGDNWSGANTIWI